MKKLNTISQNFKVVALLLTLMSGHLVFAKCLTPPVGENLARGCYVESTVWKGSRAVRRQRV
jgi:hypothetical protein